MLPRCRGPVIREHCPCIGKELLTIFHMYLVVVEIAKILQIETEFLNI